MPLNQQASYNDIEKTVLCSIKSHDRRNIAIEKASEQFSFLRRTRDELEYLSRCTDDAYEINFDQNPLLDGDISNLVMEYTNNLKECFHKQQPEFSQDQIKQMVFNARKNFLETLRVLRKNLGTHDILDSGSGFSLYDLISERGVIVQRGERPNSIYLRRSTDYVDTLFKKYPAGKATTHDAYAVFDHYLNTSLHLTSSELVNFEAVISQPKVRKKLLRTLTELFPHEGIENITTIDQGRSLSFDVAQHDEPVPLKQMGDGFKAVTTLLCRLFQQQGRACLIDEFENGIHYSLMPQLFTLVFELAHELDVQVFITTHSLDCIKAYAEAWKAYSEKTATPADTFATCHRLQWTHDQKRWANRYTLDELRDVYDLDEGDSHWLEAR
ncbi:MAG: AAA family ATPase [Vampirovibrionales bacterium]